MRLELVTGPATEPLALAEVRVRLRISHTDDDDDLDLAILRAREDAETRLGRALITQTWRLNLDCFPATGELELPRPPLQSVSSVKYIDEDGDLQTLATSEYVVDTSGEKGRLYLAWEKSWPSIRIEPNAVRVEFVAGYGDDASDVPARFRAWMLIKAGDHYAHREGTITGTIATRLEFVDELLNQEAVLF
jgi:uncharacterized phiE125 gp8 family phage protein